MNAKQHLARADRLLESADTNSRTWEPLEKVAAALEAIGHALTAIAIEAGAPHTPAPGTEVSSATGS